MTPAVTTSNYISYFVSPYHVWFRELGYPELDIVEEDCGRWSIIQYLRSPVVPCQTPWQYVLSGITHQEKTWDICAKYANQLDLEKRHVWDEQAAAEKRALEQAAADDRHQAEYQERAFQIIKSNPHLMERIAKNGLDEIKLSKISRNIPSHAFRKGKSRRRS